MALVWFVEGPTRIAGSHSAKTEQPWRKPLQDVVTDQQAVARDLGHEAHTAMRSFVLSYNLLRGPFNMLL